MMKHNPGVQRGPLALDEFTITRSALHRYYEQVLVTVRDGRAAGHDRKALRELLRFAAQARAAYYRLDWKEE